MRLIKSYDCDKLPFDSSCTERSATMSLDEMIPYCMFGITRYLSFEHRDTNSTEIRTVLKGVAKLEDFTSTLISLPQYSIALPEQGDWPTTCTAARRILC